MSYMIIGGELYHHGIKGQKWGIRRYQNADGSLTAAGQKRYGYSESGKDSSKEKGISGSNANKQRKGLSDNAKTALKVGAVAAGVALAAYGGYKLNQASTKALVESYSDIGRIFVRSAEGSNNTGAKLLAEAWNPIRSTNKMPVGEDDNTRKVFEDAADRYFTEGRINMTEAKRLMGKAKSKDFSTKERVNAAATILTKGKSELKSQKKKELFEDTVDRLNIERKRIRGY